MTNTTTKIQILRDALQEIASDPLISAAGAAREALRLTEGAKTRSTNSPPTMPRRLIVLLVCRLNLMRSARAWKARPREAMALGYVNPETLDFAVGFYRDEVPSGYIKAFAHHAPTPTAEVPDEPFYWIEADASARGADPHDVFGKDSMLYSTRLSKKKPSGSNPCWPLFLHPAPKASTEPVARSQHPIQPLIKDAHGCDRFKANKIVQHLLDHGGIGMNALARIDFPTDDREQFAQLIGYSLSGFGDLSYVTDETYESAAASIAQPASAEPSPGCARSHPHEDMDAACEAKTVQARADCAQAVCEHAKQPRTSNSLERQNPQNVDGKAAAADGERIFTAVFRIPTSEAPNVATALCGHPYWSAGSWSHALDDRDSARAALDQQQAGVPDGWEIEIKPSGRIVISKNNLGSYATKKDDEDIASYFLWELANDMLATDPTAPKAAP